MTEALPTASGRLCREYDIRAGWYADWAERIGARPQFNRK